MGYAEGDPAAQGDPVNVRRSSTALVLVTVKGGTWQLVKD